MARIIYGLPRDSPSIIRRKRYHQ